MPTTFHEIPRERPLTPLLDSANTPDELRRLAEADLETLADELRQYLLYSVGQSGGHFGAGLGVIELTIALHYVFDTPDDRLVWDVGHQAYPHKILTGRRERMGTLRQKDGLAAFPRRSESEYDTFGVGHSSTSISAALGMAIAARLKGEKRKSVAVIGDGALTAGMAFEALNHATDVGANMLVILNDNDMSISKNVGGLSNYLAKIISSRTYASMREGSKKILSRLPGAWGERIWGYGDRALGGLSALRSWQANLALWALSLLVLLLSASTNYLLFLAFGLQLPVAAALFVLVVLQVGTAPPSLPGKLGVFHYLAMLALSFFAVDRSVALGYAIALYAVALLSKVVLAGAWLAFVRWLPERAKAAPSGLPAPDGPGAPR